MHMPIYLNQCVEISEGSGRGCYIELCQVDFFSPQILKKAAIFGFLRLVCVEKNKGRKEGGCFHQTGSFEETLPGNKTSPEYLGRLVKTEPIFQSGRHQRDDTFAVSHTAK